MQLALQHFAGGQQPDPTEAFPLLPVLTATVDLDQAVKLTNTRAFSKRFWVSDFAR